jgi:hypothetical protein
MLVAAWQSAADPGAVVLGAKTEEALVDMTQRFEALRWAGSRPGVLRLLLALKEANYDESGAEFLRRIAVRDRDR